MKWVLMTLFLMIVQFGAHQQVFNLELEEHDDQRIMDAVQLASQDASMDVTQASTADGEPIFDQTQANTTFRATLAGNLDLNPDTLQPEPGSMLTVAPKILDEEFVDWSNATFPDPYVNSTYGINLTLNNPVIVMALQFTLPSYAANVQPVTITVPVVQSYQNDD